MRLTNLLFSAAVLVVCLFAREVRADTIAVTNDGTLFPAYLTGGGGFSFTPTTNLTVTKVFFEDYGATAPAIRFWANTNSVIAYYPITPGSGGGQIISQSVSLGLLAGQRYSITFEDEAFDFVAIAAYTNRAVAAALTNYTSLTISPSYEFGNFNTNLFYSGANFSFETGTAPIQPPFLIIRPGSPGIAFLEWPVAASGFVLQETAGLEIPNWLPVTNTVAIVGGTNQVTVPSLVSNRFFRLYHP